jgi:hypothetical protein
VCLKPIGGGVWSGELAVKMTVDMELLAFELDKSRQPTVVRVWRTDGAAKPTFYLLRELPYDPGVKSSKPDRRGTVGV